MRAVAAEVASPCSARVHKSLGILCGGRVAAEGMILEHSSSAGSFSLHRFVLEVAPCMYAFANFGMVSLHTIHLHFLKSSSFGDGVGAAVQSLSCFIIVFVKLCIGMLSFHFPAPFTLFLLASSSVFS